MWEMIFNARSESVTNKLQVRKETATQISLNGLTDASG